MSIGEHKETGLFALFAFSAVRLLYSNLVTPQYKALAPIVMRTYYSHKPEDSYVRLRHVIRKSLFGIAEDTGDPILDAVATAWTEHFSPRHHRDLKSHAAKLCRVF